MPAPGIPRPEPRILGRWPLSDLPEQELEAAAPELAQILPDGMEDTRGPADLN